MTIESQYFHTVFAVSLAKLDLLRAFPEAHDQDLLSELPALRHITPVQQVQQLKSRDDRSLAEIVMRFCHHYRHGLDIRFPRWDEESEFVMQMLRDLPPPSVSDRHNRFDAAWTSVRASVVWWRRRALWRKVTRLRRWVWLREEMRDLSMQMYYLVRRHALEIARRRGLGDDIFFMTYRDILVDDRSRIDGHREVYEAYRNYPAPHEIGVQPSRLPKPLDTHCSIDHWNGRAAGPGRVFGPAYVALTVAEATRMPAGSILICPFADPGWTPVLCRAAGVVAEAGGLLSHAAVICRELNVPAVLGAAHVLRDLRTGQQVMVDGNRGKVSRADTPSQLREM